MTISLNSDRAPLLPFAAGELDRSGVRMNRAEFARFLGVSKQAVGDWARTGKIGLGSDGLLDPRQAVQQLLRNTDPARLRSKVLQPLVGEVGTLQRRVAGLEAALATAREAADFEAEANRELIGQIDSLVQHLVDDWRDLRAAPADAATAALEQWHCELAEGTLDWLTVSVLDLVELPVVDAGAADEVATTGNDPARFCENEGARAA